VRAGPLSDAKVIALLNSYFVPVAVPTDDYVEGGTAPETEREAIKQILGKTWVANNSISYVVAPDGRVIGTHLNSSGASATQRVTDLLEASIQKLQTVAGQPLVKPAALSQTPPLAKPDALVLHLTARSLPGKGAWGRLPAEDWIVLDRADWSKLLGPDKVAVGTTWDLDPTAAAKFLVHFYPSSPNWDITQNRIEKQSLKATVQSLEGGVARVQIEGELRMKHHFLSLKDDSRFVEAGVVGFIDFEPEGRKIRLVRLVTDKATYAGSDFGVALRSVP
jgi:hypothetical protein